MVSHFLSVEKMKIVCAPDSFKETLPAADVALALAAGIRDVAADIEIDICPVGDGGEGTMSALLAAQDGSACRLFVTGPRCEPIKADFGITDSGIGIVELARASGLTLLPEDLRNPTLTTTFGTGELIRGAIQAGCRSVIVCIGGSATCDGGAGLAQALGVRFFDDAGALITTPLTGGSLQSIARIEPVPELPGLRVACDVTNPLLGIAGAAAVYGPQKGAMPQQVRELDAALAHLASLTSVDPTFAGAGAAGGAGFGLVALCGAALERGIDLVLDAVDFATRCRGADLVLTGEGRLDAQSLSGKAVIGVANVAQTNGCPTIVIAGSRGDGWEQCLTSYDPPGPVTVSYSLVECFGEQRAYNKTTQCIRELTAQVVQAFGNDRDQRE